MHKREQQGVPAQLQDHVERTFGDGCLGITEAEQFSGLGRTTLYSLMSSGKLTFTKIGSRRLVARRSLQELLASGVVCE